MTAHAQKPDFVFWRNGRLHLNRRGASVQSTTGSRGVRISDSNTGYTMSRGSVKSTGYPLHSPVSPSLPLPFVTVCHHISTGLYLPNLLNLLVHETDHRERQKIHVPWYFLSLKTITTITSLPYVQRTPLTCIQVPAGF